MTFEELQKELRKRLMPKGEELDAEAQKVVAVSKRKARSRFNSALRELMETEFEIYKQKEKECSSSYNVISFDDFVKVHLPASRELWGRLV